MQESPEPEEPIVELVMTAISRARVLMGQEVAATFLHGFQHSIGDLVEKLVLLTRSRHVRSNRETLTGLRSLQRTMEHAAEQCRETARRWWPRCENVVACSTDVHHVIEVFCRFISRIQPKSHVECDLRAADHMCRIEDRAISEICCVLVSNALDAHARNIRFGSDNCHCIMDGAGRCIANAFVLDCQDDGVGVPVAATEDVFGPGFTTKLHGAGWGLTIARGLARDAGGDLELAARGGPGGWTRFRLMLPVQVAQNTR